MPCKLGGRGPVHLCDERRFVSGEERGDFRQGGYEVFRELRMRCMSNDNQHGDAMANHGSEFVGLVANASVVRDNHPAALTYRLQPDFVGTVVGKMIAVSLDRRTGGGKNLRKALPEVAVGEKDRAQAARS